MSMPLPDALEALMLFFFSVGWYWSIARMLRCRTAAGKSATFALFIATGYGLGVGANLARHLEGDGNPILIAVYAWNMMVVLADLMLIFWLKVRETPASTPAARPLPGRKGAVDTWYRRGTFRDPLKERREPVMTVTGILHPAMRPHLQPV